MAVRKIPRSWQFDFKISGYDRQRKAGFLTKAEAEEAERQRRADLISGRKRIVFEDAYTEYTSSTSMKALSRDHWERCWPDIKSVLGHLYIEEVTTSEMDTLKRTLPDRYAPATVNHRLSLVRTVLRFMWKRGHLRAVPYVPMERVPRPQPKWYTEKERDRLLDGIFELRPRW
jgi:hypothetical protein